MPRNYVKKTSGPKYTNDDLQNAVLHVENGSSIYSASRKYGIPEQTVRRWVVNSPSHQGQGRSSFLTHDEERCIMETLQFLGKCGFPFDRRDVLNLVETYLMPTFTTITTPEAVSVGSPLKYLKKAILQTLSPTPSVNTVLAIENSKKKRKRVQSKCGEALTHETVLEKLAIEESNRKSKINEVKVQKEKNIQQPKKRIEKSKKKEAEELGDLKEKKESSCICRILSDSKFDSRGHYFFI